MTQHYEYDPSNIQFRTASSHDASKIAEEECLRVRTIKCGKCGQGINMMSFYIETLIEQAGKEGWTCKWSEDDGLTDLLCGECSEKKSSSISSDSATNAKPDDSHYHNGRMDPWKYIDANDLDFFEGSIIKYVTRWRYKNGIEDLEKAKVYIDELIRQQRAKME